MIKKRSHAFVLMSDKSCVLKIREQFLNKQEFVNLTGCDNSFCSFLSICDADMI